MKINIPASPHHRSLRLKGYDYSGGGLYFITICTKDRQHYFGKISNGEMILNETGSATEMYLADVSAHFGHALIAKHVIMPNHIHLILVLNDKQESAIDDRPLGDGRRHDVGTCHGMSLQAHDDGTFVGTRHGVSPPHGVSPQANLFGQPVAGSVSVIINQYKASVKRWCNNNGHGIFQWQSRFYDHIIRNEESFQNIVNYISNNPKNWENDKFYQK